MISSEISSLVLSSYLENYNDDHGDSYDYDGTGDNEINGKNDGGRFSVGCAMCMVSDVLCAGSQCSYISYVRYSVGMHEAVWKRVDRPGEPANRYIYRTYIAWATN